MSQSAPLDVLDVLIIEDEEHVAELLAEVLREDGYRVAIVGDGLRGLESVTRRQPRVVLCDVMLPGMAGTEVLLNIRAMPAVKAPAVILMSAAARPSIAPPDVPFLAKPFNIDELLCCVQSQFQQRRSGSTRS